MQMSSQCGTKTEDNTEEQTGDKRKKVRVMKGQAPLHRFWSIDLHKIGAARESELHFWDLYIKEGNLL